MSEKMTVERLQAYLDSLDDGVLKYGPHKPGREFCALEFESQVRGREWSDEPITMLDIRNINDWFGTGNEADKRRTAALLPVMAALWNWRDWAIAEKDEFIKRVNAITRDKWGYNCFFPTHPTHLTYLTHSTYPTYPTELCQILTEEGLKIENERGSQWAT